MENSEVANPFRIGEGLEILNFFYFQNNLALNSAIPKSRN